MHTGNLPKFKIYYLSEKAVTIEFGNEISEAMLQKITSFSSLLRVKAFPGFITSVPAYTTVSVFYDPIIVNASIKLTGTDCFEKVSGYLHQLCQDLNPGNLPQQRNMITIPVRYGGDFGPDIKDVALINKLAVEDVIRIHSSATYSVYMIGFVPGFAYLGGMSQLIAAPRKPTPRKAIPPGSVGIAGSQTGIYPLETPGGWQLIGKTPLLMFDKMREQPSLLQAGDEVVFRPIDQYEFEHIANSPYADSHY